MAISSPASAMQATEFSEQNKIIESRFPHEQKSAFRVCGMKKKLICLVLSILLVFSFGACNKKEDNDNFKKPVVVSSAKADSVAAAKEYANSVGAEYHQMESSQDAVLAVINGKADYVILDEYEGYALTQGNNLEFSGRCEYDVQYRACFSIDNTNLCENFNKAFSELKIDGTIDKIKDAQIKGKSLASDVEKGENGTLTMVCDAVFENRVYYDENGELKGVDIEIAKAVCNYLGYGLEIIVKDFDEMFQCLDDGTADFVLSSAEFTQERAEHFVFSDVYATLEYNVYTLK